MRVIPAIDIKNGKCVRLRQGKFDSETIYGDDPVKIAQQFVADGASMIHVVDLDGAKDKKMKNKKLIASIYPQINTSLQVGGGIRDEKTIDFLLNSGVARVIIGTLAYENLKLLKKLIKRYGEKLIVALDTKNGTIVTNGWMTSTEKSVFDMVKFFEGLSVKRLMYTDVLRDGTLTTPNFIEIKKLLQTTKIPIIVGGGITTIDDIKTLKKLGVAEIVVGKALYEKRITLKEAINAC